MRGSRTTAGSARALLGIALAAAALPFIATPAAATATPTCGAGGTPSVVALADPSFYVDTSAGLDSTYAGYTVRAGSSAEQSLWMSLDGFSGGSVALAPGQPSTVALPNIAAGSSATSYALLKAGAATVTPQTHSITLYRGHPMAGDAVCTRTFTYRGVFEAIKALANKVQSVTSTTPGDVARIGDVISVRVTGKTGQLGAGPTADPGVLSYAPNALSSFPAGAWRLEKTTMNISPDGVAAATTYTNRLYLPGASGPDRPYTADYVFRAIGPADSAAAIQPVQYIASGTQVKHTDIAGGAVGALPIVSREANLQLAKSASTDVLPSAGGTAMWTVTATNHGSTAATMDRLVDTLPSGSTYQPATSTIGGNAAANPHISGRTLMWNGPIDVPAGGTLTLTYKTTEPAVAGPHTNAAVAYYGLAELDSSRDVTVSDPASATVTVLDAAGSAKAVDDTAATLAGQTVLVDVLANDSSTGSFPLDIDAAGTPSNGTTVVRNGVVAYTPADGFAGTDTFTYTLSDGYSTDTGQVTVTVSPIARADSYVVNKNSTLNGSTVLANDDCPSCVVTLVSSSGLGTLTLNGNGTFTYVAPNQSEKASFVYKATAAGGTHATATAYIHVNAAGPDFATTPYDTNIALAVTANDTCPGGGANCQIGADNADPAEHGTTTYVGTTITYNPAANWWGLDTFSYTLNGGAGAPVKVLVGPPAKSITTTFETPVSDTAGAAATADCPGCVYAVSTSPAHGSVAMTASTGAFTYTPDAGYAGADTFAYRVTDPTSGLNVEGAVNVTVGPSAADDSYTALVRQDAVLAVLDNDSCPGTCTVTLVAGSGPARGTVGLSGNTVTYSSAPTHDIGAVTFQYRVASSLAPAITDTATVTVTVEGAEDDAAETTPGDAVTVDVRANDPCTDCSISDVGVPTAGTAALSNGAVLFTPPAGFSGTSTFSYSVTKGGFSTSALVTVVVLPEASDDEFATPEGQSLELDPRGNDLCSSCVITAAESPSGGGSAVVAGDGQSITYSPGVSAGQTESFDYTLRDTSNRTTSATVTVRVDAAPSATGDSAETNAETPVVIDVLANDGCTGCTPEVGVDAGNGSIVVRADGKAQYTPAAGFTGTDSFGYLAIDPGTGLSASATVSVVVLPVAVDDAAATAEGTPVAVAVLDNDLCSGCSVSVLSGSASVVDGEVVYTSASGVQGVETVQYRITDPSTGRTDDAVVTVTVSNAAADSATTTPGQSVDVNVLANDLCTGCTIVSVDSPANGSAEVVGSVVRYTPDAGFWGLESFTYISGNESGSSPAAVSVLVSPPVRTVLVGVNTTAGGSLVGDAPCDGCVFSFAGGTVAGDITIDPDGTWSYTPPADATPTESISYTVAHPATGLSVTGTLVVKVRASTVKAVVNVVNDSGGSATAADFPLTVNGLSVASGTANVLPAGTEYTVAQTMPAYYAQASLVCLDDDTASSVGHPFTLAAAQQVTCTVTNDDVAVVPEATLTKTAGEVVDANDSGRVDAGDTIAYGYTVANTGNAPLTNVTVTDDKIAALEETCAFASLAVGASETCDAVYTVTQADMDAGSVTNNAAAWSSEANEAGASKTVALTRMNGVSVAVAETGRESGEDSLGDVVSYRAVATNTGTTTLDAVAIAHSLTGESKDCGTMAPGATCTSDTSYTLVQGDLDSGSIADKATATGTGPDDAAVSNDDTATSTIDAAEAALSLSKTLFSEADNDDSGDRNLGDTLTYDVVATNIGGRTANGVTVADELTGESATCAAVAPGAACSLRTSHVLTEGEALAGTVSNSASALGDDAPKVTTKLDLPVVHHQGVDLTVALESLDTTVAGLADRVDAGDVATYRYTVLNTGDTALTGIALTGPLALDVECAPLPYASIASLAAGASTDCVAVHVLTQDEVDAGVVDAGASVVGKTPAEVEVDDAVALSTSLAAAPGVSLVKTVAGGSAASCAGAGESLSVERGSSVTWCFEVVNTGNVTMTDVRIADALLGLADAGTQPGVVSGGTTLAPGAALLASSSAVAGGDLLNSATASGVHALVRTASAADTAGVTVFDVVGYKVSGVVWFDADHDGERDTGEPVLPGASVSLGSGSSSGKAAAAAVSGTASTVTGAAGTYSFSDVLPGAYTITASASLASLPASWDTDGATDWSVAVVVAAGDVTADFATTPTGSIGGRATNRSTGLPVPGAAISCVWDGLDGVAGTADDVVFATVAGADGSYSLASVPPGDFACTATDPATGEKASFAAVVLGSAGTRADVQLGLAPVAGASGGGSSSVRPQLAPPTTLPRTGSNPRGAVYPGLALIALGALLVAATHPRRTNEP